ncbi:MAG: bifunctional oligoribonuclease/PAP phosphatase NrnA [Candidatus Thorarchaeota archaeon]
MNLIELLSNSMKPLIIGHQNADPDAICSMIAFSRLYKTINPNGTFTLMADDLSRLSKQVLEVLELQDQIVETPSIDFDLIVLLDTNSRLQLGTDFQDLPTSPSKTIIIDHHEPNPDVGKLADHRIVRSDRFSTCEILVDIFEEMNIPVDSNIANLLLTGILFDTRRFFYTDLQTFQIAIRLLNSGANYEKCVKSLQIRPDRSERIARLKAASKTRVHLFDDWVIATSSINAFEASACRGLLEMGADVAIIGGKPGKDKVRLSSRSTREFYDETNINLGTDIMEPLGTIIDGKGGGHANAAGANGTKNLSAALDKAVELIRAALKAKTDSTGKS